jgi:hypothetical protein
LMYEAKERKQKSTIFPNMEKTDNTANLQHHSHGHSKGNYVKERQ